MNQPDSTPLPSRPSCVAVVGAGVIGAAWAARWVMRGVDVCVSDPSPDASRVVAEVLESARRAWDRLDLAPRSEGALRFESLEDSVSCAPLIQESAQEDVR